MELAVDERQTARTTLHQGAVARVIDAMRKDLAITLSLNQMADIACFSPFHFNRMFKAITGIPPHQFLYALRLEHAKRLLIFTDLSVTEICFEARHNSLEPFVQRVSGFVGLFSSVFQGNGFKLLKKVAPEVLQPPRIPLEPFDAYSLNQ